MPQLTSRLFRPWGILILIAFLLGVGWLTRERWLSATSQWAQRTLATFRQSNSTDPHAGDAEVDSHAGHDHAGHSEETSLELSEQGLRNIGLTADLIRPVELETFRRSITVPALVVERPGRTLIEVATPMTGVVTRVHAVQGEAVAPGTLLFQIRLTHEDLVQVQTDFLKTLGELDVEEREIERLTGVTSSGAVAGKLLLDREYARDKLTALLQAQREALRLHGLSTEQVEKIASERRLLRELQVFAPFENEADAGELQLTGREVETVSLVQKNDVRPQADESATPLILKELRVHKGQSVGAGETLCTLADYSELFIEGQAFDQDIPQLRTASENGWRVEAIFEGQGASQRIVDGLPIAYLANHVDLASRTLHFYVQLPNGITQDRRAEGNRYVEWMYLPGQRLQLRVPVEEWTEQIVLTVDAVVREGAEYFVFQQNGDHFDRVPVHVKYRDQFAVVINNDGSLFPGDVVAHRGAHQMQMALKNKAGGGVDAHHGHTH